MIEINVNCDRNSVRIKLTNLTEKTTAVPVTSYNGFTPIVLVLGVLISPIKHRFVVAPKEKHIRMNGLYVLKRCADRL